jgi:hypothetical protein
MTDYIDLKPDDVIREGDEWTCPSAPGWGRTVDNTRFIGTTVESHSDFKFRRPRSTLIRDAAIDAAREWYWGEGLEDMSLVIDALRETLGISVEQLREGK